MFTNDNTECSTKVTVISQNKFDKWLEKQPTFIRNWCLSNNFKGENSKILKIPYPDGRLKEVLIGEGLNQDLSAVSDFSSKNKGNYYLFIKFADSKEIEIQKAWAWGGYKFNKSSPKNLIYVKNPETLRYLNETEQAVSFYYSVENSQTGIKVTFAIIYIIAVSYTHLTLPTNREV